MGRIPNGVYSYRRDRELQRTRDGGSKKFRQSDLAKFLSIPRTRISMIENGHVLPTPEELLRLAEYLETTPGHLYEKEILSIIYDLGEQEGKADEIGKDNVEEF